MLQSAVSGSCGHAFAACLLAAFVVGVQSFGRVVRLRTHVGFSIACRYAAGMLTALPQLAVEAW
eukprot:2737446-Alexandrium_andersonii.AAC.1